MSGSRIRDSRSRFLERLNERAQADAALTGPDAQFPAAEFTDREAPPWEVSSDDNPSDTALSDTPTSDTASTNAALREIRARRRPRPEPVAGRHEASTASPTPSPMPSRTAREAARNADVLPFRRSPTARRVRRLRRHPVVRWLQPLAIALLLVGIPAAVTAWTLRAPAFAVDEIRISADSPARRVPAPWVLEQLKSLQGENLWLLDLQRPVDEIQKHQWVRDIGIRKQPPSTLVVRVLEKKEVAIYDDVAGPVYVAEDGSRIAPVDANGDATGLAVLRGELVELALGKPAPELRAAVALLTEIQQAGAPWAAGLEQVEILSTRDFRVHTNQLPFPLLVRAGTVESRSSRLEQLLPWISELGRLRAVDLRFARRIIVEPAEPEAPSARTGDPEAT